MSRTDQTWTWTHGRTSAPINAALGALVAALAVRVAHVPVWPVLIAGSVLAIMSALIAAKRGKPPIVVWFHSGCWVTAASWIAWMALDRNTHWAIKGGTLGVAAVVAWMLSPLLRPAGTPVITAAEQAAAEQQALEKLPMETQLAMAIRRLASIKTPVEVVKHNEWPEKAGTTYHVDFAGSGKTWTALSDVQASLAADFRQPPGCPIVTRPSPHHQGAALLDVTRVNALEKITHFPTLYLPRSIVNDFPLGPHADSTHAMANLYQTSSVVGGLRDWGKTVILQGMTAHMVMCFDTLVWHVDLNGGGLGAPWTSPYAQGLIKRPVVDWVAPTAAVALEMSRVALAIAKDRKAFYQGLKLSKNTSVLPISSHLPAIAIFVDEGYELTGEEVSAEAQEAAANFREIQRIGRADCVIPHFGVLRGVAEFFPTSMKKLTGLGMSTRAWDQDEVDYLLDHKSGVRVGDLTDRGMFGYRRLDDPNGAACRIARSYLITPQQIGDIAVAAQDWRPDLDPRGKQVGGSVYADRWEHPDVREYVDRLAGRATTPSRPIVVSQREPLPGSIEHISRSVTALINDVEQDEPERHTPVYNSATQLTQDEIDGILNELAKLPTYGEAIGTTDAQTILAVLADAGPAGMKMAELLRVLRDTHGLNLDRRRVHEHLVHLRDTDNSVYQPKHGHWAIR